MTSRRRLLKLLAAGAAMGAALLRRAAAAGNQLRRDDSRECDIRPQDLRLEWRAGPIGVESRRPRLTWTLAADPLLRGVKQSACQVILASSKDAGSLRPLPLRVGRGSRLLAQEERSSACQGRSPAGNGRHAGDPVAHARRSARERRASSARARHHRCPSGRPRCHHHRRLRTLRPQCAPLATYRVKLAGSL